jgi:AmmeMemoRadiSam system protein A
MSADLAAEDRAALLRIAREAIVAGVAGERYAPADLRPALEDKRGAFVTLHERSSGDLRGCIGYIEPLFSLAETVARAGVAAALNDHRFEPVTAGELPGLAIEISVLSPPEPIRPEDVVVGTHGLILSLGNRAGLLLPQVPVEWGWDREAFLDQTCRKAGLPPGTWRRSDARLLGFTATVFGEE